MSGNRHKALYNTLKHRGKEGLLTDIQDIIKQILSSHDIQKHWDKYRTEYAYAAEIEFKQIASALKLLFEWAYY